MHGGQARLGIEVVSLLETGDAHTRDPTSQRTVLARSTSAIDNRYVARTKHFNRTIGCHSQGCIFVDPKSKPDLFFDRRTSQPSQAPAMLAVVLVDDSAAKKSQPTRH